MNQETTLRRDRTAIHAVLPFVRSSVPSRPRRVIDQKLVEVGYWVHDVALDRSRQLDGDPTIARPIPTVRLTINAASTFVVVLLAGLGLAAIAPAVLGYQAVVVTSGSMEPAIKVADVVLTRPSDGIGLDRGTVINYDHEDTTQLHRIIATTDDGYRTAGDANVSVDSQLVQSDEVRGVGAVVVPFVGLPAVWVERHQWLYAGMALVVLVAALYTSRTNWVGAEVPWP